MMEHSLLTLLDILSFPPISLSCRINHHISLFNQRQYRWGWYRLRKSDDL